MSDVLKAVVDGIWLEGRNNLAVRLRAEDGQPLPGWQPGAHIDVHLPCGLIRQYSLTGNCEESGSYLICVARESASRGGSRYIHETLRPGQKLLISPPRNLFPLHAASRVILLAAGIGITPLYSMARSLAAQGVPFVLHYYVKQRHNAALLGDIAAHFRPEEYVIHCSAEGSSARDSLGETLPPPEADCRLYVCGPAGFMDAVSRQAAASGWPEMQVHSEAFQPLALPTACGAEETFTVTLASSGEKWPVPGDKTIAQVLMANGVAIPLSCEMGMCGACLTPVIRGEVDHRDTVQSAAEKAAAVQQIALCCSRSRSGDLVLDL